MTTPADRRVPAAGASLSWPLAEIALFLAATAAALALVHAFAVGARYQPVVHEAHGFGPWWAAGMLALAVAAQLVQRLAGQAPSRAVVAVLAGLAAGLVTAPLTAGLQWTDQPLNTILGGDMQFRTENVTRFASTWHLEDYTCRGLRAFYPPGWFWVAGRAAHWLTPSEPWRIMKPFTIFTIGAAFAVAYGLWRMVLSPAGALSAAIGSSMVLQTQIGPVRFATLAWYSPYSAFVAVTGAAWLAASLRAVRERDRRGQLMLLGVAGAALALCYYLLFIILVVVLIALAAATPAARGRALLRVAALCTGIAILTSVFWIPLLEAVRHGAVTQGHFVRPDFYTVATGITGGPVMLTVLSVAALVALALTITWTGSQAVAGVIAGSILYQLISVATLTYAQAQLQPHRAVTMMWASFGAAVPVAFEAVGSSAPSRLLRPWLAKPLALLGIAAALWATFGLGSALANDLVGGPYVAAIYQRSGYQRLSLDQASLLSSYITSTTGKAPQQLTIVSDQHALLVTEPYFGFLPLGARYAHPLAHLTQRIGVLQMAAACPTAACTTRELTHSQFGQIDALVLKRTPAGLLIQATEDRFPDPLPVQIYFRTGSFDPAVWVSRKIPGYRVFVRRPGAG
ncbi:MAG: arabinofuranosyltransferase [Gemmatimonadota bacterium]